MLTTTYSTTGIGNTVQWVSPDTGTSSATFDAAGNMVTRTDARGKTVSYSHDALGRVTLINYPTGTDTTLEYDGGSAGAPNAVGRLTKMVDESGNTTFGYDARGRVTSKTQTVGTGSSAKVRTVTYAYGTTGSAKGKLVSITYASGNRVNYGYDAAGRVSWMTLNPTNSNGTGTNTGTTVALVADIAYEPTGAVKSWSWGASASGNGVTRTYDLDGRLTSYPLGHPSEAGLVRTVHYDAASRITGYTHVNGSGQAQPAYDQTFSYDDLNRLTYSDRGRLKSVSLGAGTVSYVYNALEQRVRKSGPTSLVATGASLYVYDEAGRLLGDYTPALRVVRETVYLGEMPIVVLGQTVTGSPASFTTQVYRVYADQIGAPRVITQATDNKMRWRWDSAEPFGTTPAQENPAAVGVFGYDPRFAGQMRDKETGLHYNWHRDYDAGVGRYVQSDPIGLAGGINTFSYVGGNPNSYSDPWGLIKIPGIPGATGGTSVHANPGPDVTDFRPEHGPAHVHLGANDGPRVRTNDFKPFSDEDARKMTRKQKQFCEGLADSARDRIRRAQQSIFRHGRLILQIQGGGLLSIAAACRNDPVWCAEQIEAGHLP